MGLPYKTWKGLKPVSAGAFLIRSKAIRSTDQGSPSQGMVSLTSVFTPPPPRPSGSVGEGLCPAWEGYLPKPGGFGTLVPQAYL